MKFIRIFILVVALFITSHRACAGWWSNNDQQEKAQIAQLQQHLQEQQEKGSGMVVIIAVLSIGCVVVLLVGTAIGSKCRRDYTKGEVEDE